ncbi:hypothetical protein HPB49_011246 [Dermacentor silvarum]|uniref:Uncharacterized protein n=1 Tax=Dermacentor silvarum TaxID=543639 RepID=A0ACB8DCB9_DERSI|nr:hypothetical protein HPB49_011246 [Dermacentor silvarum]
MVITFLGKTVPYYIEFSGLLLRCYLYKRTVPHCRTCNETGHREDVCPRPPATPKCRECGTSLVTEQHECHPRCSLCGGNHPTAAKTCPNRFLPPVNRRKPQQALRAGSSSPRPRGERSASRKSRSPKRRGADLIATTDAIPWQDLEPWTFRKWQEGKQGRNAGHAAELAQAHAQIRRLTEENATLKAEISKVHAESGNGKSNQHTQSLQIRHRNEQPPRSLHHRESFPSNMPLLRK